jgi:hypothetical protein
MIDADGDLLAGNKSTFDKMTFQNLTRNIGSHGILLTDGNKKRRDTDKTYPGVISAPEFSRYRTTRRMRHITFSPVTNRSSPMTGFSVLNLSKIKHTVSPDEPLLQ